MSVDDEIWDLLNSDLSEDEILAQLASHPDQDAVAAVTGCIISLIRPQEEYKNG